VELPEQMGLSPVIRSNAACALACCTESSITIKTEKAATPLAMAVVVNFCLFTVCKIVPIIPDINFLLPLLLDAGVFFTVFTEKNGKEVYVQNLIVKTRFRA